MDKKANYASIDEYIAAFPDDVRKKLGRLRLLIRQMAPEAQEKISYQMPAFFLDGNLVYFAAFSKHIGFYPGAGGVAKFKRELAKYKSAKGSVQFPLDEELPIELIKRIVKYRVEENARKTEKQARLRR